MPQPKKRRYKVSDVQPVHLRYGYMPGDTWQPIPVIDRNLGGEGLKINFSEDLEDPNSHHSNTGGISIVNGPGSSTGYDVWGTISLWIRDLWAPDPSTRTECQVWMSHCEVVSGGASGATVKTFPAHEFYAPLQHDALVWDVTGAVSQTVEDHDFSTKHVVFAFQPMFVPNNRRVRAHICQFHGDPNEPVSGNPYPGHIHKAWADLCVLPR